MGNAWDTVKERADYVTTSVDDDGIWKACEHFGLCSPSASFRPCFAGRLIALIMVMRLQQFARALYF